MFSQAHCSLPPWWHKIANNLRKVHLIHISTEAAKAFTLVLFENNWIFRERIENKNTWQLYSCWDE